MSIMSDIHQEIAEGRDQLETIHNILLGQRQVAALALKAQPRVSFHQADMLERKIEVIDDLLLEFEAAGVVWPTNVVELNTVTGPTVQEVWDCGGQVYHLPSNHPEDGV